MELLKKRILAKLYHFKIYFKSIFAVNIEPIKSLDIETLVDKYSHKEKIVVMCSGPSTNQLSTSSSNLYLTTNSAYSLVKNEDCIYYVNDGFFIKKILSQGHFLKSNQELVFFYYEGAANLKDQKFLVQKISLLKNKHKYFISREINSANYNYFINFYKDKNLPIKIQNSGVFLLLFGYLLAEKMNVPLEIYGLDLGIGGAIHYDSKGIVGKSVLKDGVKENVKMYLSYMYQRKRGIKNYSNFFSNIKK